MERPSLNPMLADLDAESARLDKADRSCAGRNPMSLAGAFVANIARRAVCCTSRLLLADVVFWRRRPKLRDEIGTPTSRFLHAILYRLAFTPVIVALFAVAAVWVATHPQRLSAAEDPSNEGIYFDAINFAADDSTRLEGWLVPVVDERAILADRDEALRRRYPAVILAHDFGMSRRQMLPLVRPLHDAGFVVLLVGLRGSDASGAGGSTFGLRESHDLQAAVELMRRRPFVDGNRLALVGTGSGATAALLAAARDPRIAAVVLDRLPADFDARLNEQVGPRPPYLGFLTPLCRWTFELAYSVDPDEVQDARKVMLDGARPVLLTGDAPLAAPMLSPDGLRLGAEFLRLHVGDNQAAHR